MLLPSERLEQTAALTENVLHAFSVWRAHPRAVVEDDGVVMRIATPVPLAMMNLVVARAPLLAGDPRLAATTTFFDAHGLPAAWWDFPAGHSPQLADELAAQGFAAQGVAPGMARALFPGDAVPTYPDDVVCNIVEDDAAMAAWTSVVLRGFRIVPAHRAALAEYLAHYPALPDMCLMLACDAGTPVAAGLVLRHAAVAGLYWITTLPTARGRGYGAAITRALLAQGIALGCRLAVLQSTPAGLRLYRRLGFHTVCRVGIYARDAMALSRAA